MTDMTPETKPVSLKEQFASAAITLSGAVVMLVPLLHKMIEGPGSSNNLSPFVLGGCIGLGTYLSACTWNRKENGLKACFTKAKNFLPALGLGMLLGTVTTFAAMSDAAKHADVTPIDVEEEFFQAAAKELCALEIPPREVAITLGAVTRTIPCP